MVDECNETVDEELKILDNNENKCNSSILYVVLFSMFFAINVGIANYFVCYKYTNRNKENVSNMIMFIMRKIININGRN